MVIEFFSQTVVCEKNGIVQILIIFLMQSAALKNIFSF